MPHWDRHAWDPLLVCAFLLGVSLVVIGERLGHPRATRAGALLGVATVAAIGAMSLMAWWRQG